MKTPSSRVRKERSAATAARQVKTLPDKSVTLVFNSVEDGKEMFRVEVPEPLFSRVRRACEELHIDLAQFFRLAMQRKHRRELLSLRMA